MARREKVRCANHTHLRVTLQGHVAPEVEILEGCRASWAASLRPVRRLRGLPTRDEDVRLVLGESGRRAPAEDSIAGALTCAHEFTPARPRSSASVCGAGSRGLARDRALGHRLGGDATLMRREGAWRGRVLCIVYCVLCIVYCEVFWGRHTHQFGNWARSHRLHSFWNGIHSVAQSRAQLCGTPAAPQRDLGSAQHASFRSSPILAMIASHPCASCAARRSDSQGSRINAANGPAACGAGSGGTVGTAPHLRFPTASARSAATARIPLPVPSLLPVPPSEGLLPTGDRFYRGPLREDPQGFSPGGRTGAEYLSVIPSDVILSKCTEINIPR